MGERRRHFAHRGQARDVDEFGLQFLQPGFRSLPFSQITDEAGKETLVARIHFADGKLHRECRAVLALPHHDAADADDASLAGP
jgi:hypothetical protein